MTTTRRRVVSMNTGHLELRPTSEHVWLTLWSSTGQAVEVQATNDDIDYLIATLTRMRDGK